MEVSRSIYSTGPGELLLFHVAVQNRVALVVLLGCQLPPGQQGILPTAAHDNVITHADRWLLCAQGKGSE